MVTGIRDQLASREFGHLAFLNQAAVLSWFDRVSNGAESGKQDADPLLHTLLSCLALQNAYHMS